MGMAASWGLPCQLEARPLDPGVVLLSFPDPNELVHLHILEFLGGASRPVDLDAEDPLGLAHSDFLPEGVGSEGSATVDPTIDGTCFSVLFQLQPDPGSDGRTARSGPLQL